MSTLTSDGPKAIINADTFERCVTALMNAVATVLHRKAKMINGIENIAAIFSIFHDGVIAGYVRGDKTLTMEIEIEYLARRIKPDYTRFFVALHGVSQISFLTWPSVVGEEPVLMKNGEQVLATRMDILEGYAKEGLIEVTCMQSNSTVGFCGGELYLACTSAIVTDQGGRQYELDQLDTIGRQYWQEWAEKNRKGSGA
jgi:hypothetical protein